LQKRKELIMRDAMQGRIGDPAGHELAAASGLWRRNAMLLAVGAGLAAAALLVRQRTRKAERDNPPLGRFVYVDGVRLHYVERGAGQPLVLLHGDGSMIQDFETSGLIDAAAKRYRVIVFDRPGFGYSERPRGTVWTPQAQAALLHRALRLLDVDRPIMVGHSWGTLVAVALALDFPRYVKSLVLLSGYYYPTLRLDVPLLSPPAIPLVGDLMRYTVSPLVTRMLWRPLTKRVFSPQQVDARFRELPVWMLLRPSQLRASAAETAMMVPSALALAKHYTDLKVPVVIMAGTQDKIVDFGHNSERLDERLPDSELHLHPGIGHMTHYAHTDKVMGAIDGIAARVGESVYRRNPQAEALARASESGT
jgi:pimeloyl-ACP methyl ester carboxylesterase